MGPEVQQDKDIKHNANSQSGSYDIQKILVLLRLTTLIMMNSFIVAWTRGIKGLQHLPG